MTDPHSNIDWPAYFRLERTIELHALAADVPTPRATALARSLACRPLNRPDLLRRARTLAQIRARRGRDLLHRVGTPGSQDATILAAHRQLASLEPDACPPLASVRVQRSPHEGWCIRGVVFINPDGAFYRAAETGDLGPLTMLLHHEQFHALHGADETAARRASLTFCERHGIELPSQLTTTTRS